MPGWLKTFFEGLDGFRKLLLCVVITIFAGIPLLLLRRISGDNWASIACTAITAYCGSNVAEYGLDALHAWINSKIPPS